VEVDLPISSQISKKAASLVLLCGKFHFTFLKLGMQPYDGLNLKPNSVQYVAITFLQQSKKTCFAFLMVSTFGRRSTI